MLKPCSLPCSCVLKLALLCTDHIVVWLPRCAGYTDQIRSITELVVPLQLQAVSSAPLSSVDVPIVYVTEDQQSYLYTLAAVVCAAGLYWKLGYCAPLLPTL